MTDREILEQILEGQKLMQADITDLQKGQKSLQKDVKQVKNQVNILYDWVDGIDIDVRNVKKAVYK